MRKRKRGIHTAGKHSSAKRFGVMLFALALIGLGAAALIHARSASKPIETPEPSDMPQIEIVLDRVDADEGVSHKVLLELMKIDSGKKPASLGLSSDKPTVLIYHTHATEAYFPTKEHTYTPSSKWRTHDNSMNVVAVGERLCALLKEEYGITAIHDTTDHEPPKLSTAYSRSLITMQKYKKEYPSLELFIDLHRDSYGRDPEKAADYITVNGKESARIMFVVGTGEGATGAGFDEMPDFQSNFALAKAISEYLSSIHPELARNIRVKVGRYNQHVSSHCLLAEIGHNANTLEQAMNAVEFLAEAIANVADVSPASAAPVPAETERPPLQLSP